MHRKRILLTGSAVFGLVLLVELSRLLQFRAPMQVERSEYRNWLSSKVAPPSTSSSSSWTREDNAIPSHPTAEAAVEIEEQPSFDESSLQWANLDPFYTDRKHYAKNVSHHLCVHGLDFVYKQRPYPFRWNRRSCMFKNVVVDKEGVIHYYLGGKERGIPSELDSLDQINDVAGYPPVILHKGSYIPSLDHVEETQDVFGLCELSSPTKNPSSKRQQAAEDFDYAWICFKAHLQWHQLNLTNQILWYDITKTRREIHDFPLFPRSILAREENTRTWSQLLAYAREKKKPLLVKQLMYAPRRNTEPSNMRRTRNSHTMRLFRQRSNPLAIRKKQVVQEERHDVLILWPSLDDEDNADITAMKDSLNQQLLVLPREIGVKVQQTHVWSNMLDIEELREQIQQAKLVFIPRRNSQAAFAVSLWIQPGTSLFLLEQQTPSVGEEDEQEFFSHIVLPEVQVFIVNLEKDGKWLANKMLEMTTQGMKDPYNVDQRRRSHAPPKSMPIMAWENLPMRGPTSSSRKISSFHRCMHGVMEDRNSPNWQRRVCYFENVLLDSRGNIHYYKSESDAEEDEAIRSVDTLNGTSISAEMYRIELEKERREQGIKKRTNPIQVPQVVIHEKGKLTDFVESKIMMETGNSSPLHALCRVGHMAFHVGHDYDYVLTCFEAMLQFNQLEMHPQILLYRDLAERAKNQSDMLHLGKTLLTKAWSMLSPQVSPYENLARGCDFHMYSIVNDGEDEHGRGKEPPNGSKYDHCFVKKLLYAPQQKNVHNFRDRDTHWFRAFRDRALDVLDIPRPPENLHVQNQKRTVSIRYKHRRGHRITNHEQIVEYLKAKYPRFETLDFRYRGGMTMKEEVQLIQSIDFYITPGGGGAFSMILMKDGAEAVVPARCICAEGNNTYVDPQSHLVVNPAAPMRCRMMEEHFWMALTPYVHVTGAMPKDEDVTSIAWMIEGKVFESIMTSYPLDLKWIDRTMTLFT